MAFYINHSRYPAIVTVHVQSTSDPQASLETGVKTIFKSMAADVGYHDILIDPETELNLKGDTVAVLLGARAAG